MKVFILANEKKTIQFTCFIYFMSTRAHTCYMFTCHAYVYDYCWSWLSATESIEPRMLTSFVRCMIRCWYCCCCWYNFFVLLDQTIYIFVIVEYTGEISRSIAKSVFRFVFFCIGMLYQFVELKCIVWLTYNVHWNPSTIWFAGVMHFTLLYFTLQQLLHLYQQHKLNLMLKPK